MTETPGQLLRNSHDSERKSVTLFLSTFYSLTRAHGPESIKIFGPGKAKGELKERLIRHKMGARIAGVETVDKMTDRQIAAKVRQHFAD